jgi:hypothetical protein
LKQVVDFIFFILPRPGPPPAVIRVLVAVLFFSRVLNLKLQLLRLQEVSQLFEILFSFLAWRLVIDNVIGDINPNFFFCWLLGKPESFPSQNCNAVVRTLCDDAGVSFVFFFPAVFARS